MRDQFYVYIMINVTKSVLYTGMTNDLKRRVYEHKQGSGSVLTRQYKAGILVYYEVFSDPVSAIAREKQIKNYSRARKIALVYSFNPEWNDLYPVL